MLTLFLRRRSEQKEEETLPGAPLRRGLGRVREQTRRQSSLRQTQWSIDCAAQELQVRRHPVEHEVSAALQMGAPERTADVREGRAQAEDAGGGVAGAQGGRLLPGEPRSQRQEQKTQKAEGETGQKLNKLNHHSKMQMIYI